MFLFTLNETRRMMTVLKMVAGIMTMMFGMMLTSSNANSVFTLHTEKMMWSEAQTLCSQDGGTLISNYRQEDIRDLMTNISTPVWEGRYYSSWAWLLGCYSFKGSFDYIEIKDNQMKECLNHCPRTNYFGLQDKKCFCFDTFDGSYLQTKINCKHVCPGNTDETCGGDNALTIYMNDICYKNSAQWQGTVSQTWSGKQCLPWANITEVNRAGAKQFPDGSAMNASNFCRDPFGKSSLGCYVNKKDWEMCDIPPCIIVGTENDEVSCMSFRKPEYKEFQFQTETCEAHNFAFCAWDNKVFWRHSKGTWEHARDQSRQYYEYLFGRTRRCMSLAGPRIFWLNSENDVLYFHWFGYFRQICTVSKIVPNRTPKNCFSLLKDTENMASKVEDCNNRNAFICQYAPQTCGGHFNNSLLGSFETPGYNDTLGYGDFQRCVWTITVPENHFISLSLDVFIENSYKCRSDFIRVFVESYDKGVSLCGEKLTTFNTTGNRVTIEFRSDGTMNNFRGALVNWSAVPVLTLPTKQTTSKLSMTSDVTTGPGSAQTTHGSAQTTHSFDMTTMEQLGAGAGSGNYELAGGALAGLIAGLVVAIGLILGIVLFLIRRRNSSKNKETKNDTAQKLKNRDANSTSSLRDIKNIDTGKRPSSEIYQNTAHDTASTTEDAEYSTVHGTTRENAVIVNGVSVSYMTKDNKNGRYPRSEDPSEVYNTLNETTKTQYQNHTENVYNRFDDSHAVYDHTATETSNQNNDSIAGSGMQTYDHLNDDKYTYAHTSSYQVQKNKTVQ